MGVGEACRHRNTEEWQGVVEVKVCVCVGGGGGGGGGDPGDTRPHSLQVQAHVETVSFVLFLPRPVLPRLSVVGVDLR